MADPSADLLPVAETLRRLMAEVPAAPPAEEVSLEGAHRRVLAETQYAGMDVPPAANSEVDGYAGCFADGSLAAGKPLRISARIPAGQVGPPMATGTVARIFTGAPLPDGADAVVMQEDTRSDGDTVVLERLVKPGENVRPRGQDIASGSLLLEQGIRLLPQELGLLASVGIARVPVHRRLRIALLCTGDELAEPGDSLRPGQIYNSNRILLRGLIEGLGFECIDIGTVADSRAATERALADAAARADCIVSSGGVSVGEEDYVKEVVESLGRLSLWRIAIKPGKPLAFGRVGEIPFFGLPGNPVSAFVTLLILARPYLLRYQGLRAVDAPRYQFPAGFALRAGNREEYLRVRIEETAAGTAEIRKFSNQGSGILTSASWAGGLAVVPAGHEVRQGDALAVYLLNDLLN